VTGRIKSHLLEWAFMLVLAVARHSAPRYSSSDTAPIEVTCQGTAEQWTVAVLFSDKTSGP
jgi:hypothetical protein